MGYSDRWTGEHHRIYNAYMRYGTERTFKTRKAARSFVYDHIQSFFKL